MMKSCSTGRTLSSRRPTSLTDVATNDRLVEEGVEEDEEAGEGVDSETRGRGRTEKCHNFKGVHIYLDRD